MEKLPKFEYQYSGNEELLLAELHSIKYARANTPQKRLRWFTDMPRFAKSLEARHPDARNYRLFHLLIDSTPSPGTITHFDFPGDDSIEKFIREYKDSNT